MQTTLLDHGAAAGTNVEDSVKSLKIALRESAGNDRESHHAVLALPVLADNLHCTTLLWFVHAALILQVARIPSMTPKCL